MTGPAASRAGFAVASLATPIPSAQAPEKSAKNGKGPHPHTPQICFGFNPTRSFVFCNLREILIEPMFRVEFAQSESKSKLDGNTGRRHHSPSPPRNSVDAQARGGL